MTITSSVYGKLMTERSVTSIQEDVEKLASEASVRGYNRGHTQGFKEGYEKGLERGKKEGKADNTMANYAQTWREGYEAAHFGKLPSVKNPYE